MRAKEVQLRIVVVVLCWTAKSARAAPNMAQVERKFT